MPPALLITQCLQNDFVKPIGRHDPLPNLLHVGYEEARRLIGENPSEGPVARLMQWAGQQCDEQLRIIHVRDWHDPNDPNQSSHLKQFGPHCLGGTEGARFAFDEGVAADKFMPVIDSLTLNDFAGTHLASLLAPFAGGPAKVGLIGVWTEAKITFLAYELRTRYPDFQIAVCSALTAGSSRAQHFIALDLLEKLLGVLVIPSLGAFSEFLIGKEMPLPDLSHSSHLQIEFDGGCKLSGPDGRLLRYLLRDCRSARVRCLDGGYSGNVVLGSQSADLHGHQQAPHVIKIGPQALIGKERSAFERVESVLGNNAPRIADFADLGERGAIKYRYASMGGGFSTTFQKLYMGGLPMDGVQRILRTVFGEQLGRFYRAASPERCDLLAYYGFSRHYAPRVRQRVEKLLGAGATGATLRFSNGQAFPHPAWFYEHELDRRPPPRGDSSYFAYVHGDLNGANIIVDGQTNVWLIDFFHTHRGHVLKDLIKLENDLLYIFTPIQDQAAFDEALRLTEALMRVEDLGQPLPEWDRLGLTHPPLRRAYETLAFLRTFYPDLIQSDRDPLQLFIGQMRYAMHTLNFNEASDWQKKWALYTAALCGSQICARWHRTGPGTSPGSVANSPPAGR